MSDREIKSIPILIIAGFLEGKSLVISERLGFCRAINVVIL